MCGGYMPASMVKQCLPGLECVNTMGPMIADAPGVCKRGCPKLSPSRDMYGNCVEPGCRSWFDGCNNCLVGERGQLDALKCSVKILLPHIVMIMFKLN